MPSVSVARDRPDPIRCAQTTPVLSVCLPMGAWVVRSGVNDTFTSGSTQVSVVAAFDSSKYTVPGVFLTKR